MKSWNETRGYSSIRTWRTGGMGGLTSWLKKQKQSFVLNKQKQEKKFKQTYWVTQCFPLRHLWQMMMRLLVVQIDSNQQTCWSPIPHSNCMLPKYFSQLFHQHLTIQIIKKKIRFPNEKQIRNKPVTLMNWLTNASWSTLAWLSMAQCRKKV